MLGLPRIWPSLAGSALLALSALSWTGCGNGTDTPPTTLPPNHPPEGGVDSASDHGDSAADRGGDSAPDSGADDGNGAGGDSSGTDGGPSSGPGCGGCFADEIQAGGQCFTNTSCGSPPNAVMTRLNGACSIASCHAGWGDCDGKADNGCEADLTRPENCNQCGNKCPTGQICGTSGCAPTCTPPATDCGNACVDVSSSPLHCGDCSTECPTRQWHRPTCTAGVCGLEMICGPGSVRCGSGCNLLDEDPANCGACGRSCPSPAGGTVSCRAGACIPHCPATFTLCGDTCVDLQTDPAHCNACGRACTMGGCVAGACDPSWSPVLATGTAPTALAVDDTSVYWLETQAGTVMKAPKGGGAAVRLATAQATPFDLALDATSVYWSNRAGNAIMRIAKAGGAAPEVVVTATEPMHIATDGASVFFEQPVASMDGGLVIPVLLRTRIGSGTTEEFWQFPNGETDSTLTRVLVDERFVYWAGRRNTVSGAYFTFEINKEIGATLRAFAGVWGELAMDEAFIYTTNGPASVGGIQTVAAIGKSNGKGWGILQFLPEGAYQGGGYMAVGDTYLYRSSPGELTGINKVLKCGTNNIPVKVTGNADRWSYLVADGSYVYGVLGADIRRAHR